MIEKIINLKKRSKKSKMQERLLLPSPELPESVLTGLWIRCGVVEIFGAKSNFWGLVTLNAKNKSWI
jgi:hypothetical protein